MIEKSGNLLFSQFPGWKEDNQLASEQEKGNSFEIGDGFDEVSGKWHERAQERMADAVAVENSLVPASTNKFYTQRTQAF